LLLTCAMSVSQRQLLSLVPKCDGQRGCIWYAWESLRRVHCERLSEDLGQHGRHARMHRIRQPIRCRRSADVHKPHAETKRALGTDTQILEEEEDARLAVLVLKALGIRRERADECARVRMPRERWDCVLPVPCWRGWGRRLGLRLLLGLAEGLEGVLSL